MIKRAFLEGLQLSLVESGAIPPYPTKWHAKHALDQAEAKSEIKKKVEEESAKIKAKSEGKDEPDEPKVDKDDPQNLTEEEVADMMTDVVDAEPLDDAVAALKEYQEAAGDSELASEELADALEDIQDSKEAALAIRRLKLAGSTATGGGPVGDELQRASGNLESGYGDPSPNPIKTVAQSPALDLVAEGSETNSSHLAQFDNAGVKGKKSAKKAPTEGEVKAAMAILRKLAGEDPSEDMGAVDAPDHEHDSRQVHPNPVTHMEMSEATSQVMPLPKQTVSASADADHQLAQLVAKTAQEVGHFLPQELSSSDKLAALRTMVGMNGQERASYIGRIKQAMYQDSSSAYTSQDDHAAQVLRNLGL